MTAAAGARRVQPRKLTAADRVRLADSRDRLDTDAFTLGREADEAMVHAYAAPDPRDFRRFALLACSRYVQAAMKTSQAKSCQTDLDRGWVA